tara:strand:+ start:187 stop:357 length:171 start_codon:yes stop_codon:yes gene_type:complete
MVYFSYFFIEASNKDSTMAIKTSKIGVASGYPKFHKTTRTNQINQGKESNLLISLN